ncbi:hypothetical protein BH23ACT12_BH23ACT12_08860 [soil metagenome]
MPESSKELRVDDATPEDRIAIAHLNVWAYREYSIDLGAERWPEMVRALTAAGASRFLVVREDGDLLGSAAYRHPGLALSPLPAAWASIHLLAVSPDARREGIATALVHSCLELARTDGAVTVGATVNGLMTGAQALFAGLGFRREQGLPKRDEPHFWIYRMDLIAGQQS